MRNYVETTTKHECPACGSRKLRRSRRKGLVETVILYLNSAAPYRCSECDARFYVQPKEPRTKADGES